jgi:DeoR/GlpR family transcriptional regulator of sugar metabolism
MLKKERLSLILREVNIHNKVILSDLSQKLSVSEDTIRRDLQELADEDKLIKVRGGALSKSYQAYSYREHDIYAYQEKTIIARKAISLLRDDMLVLISGGSTNLEIARILPPELRVTFVTVSLTTALQLMEHPNSETLFLGGMLSKNAKIVVGGAVIQHLNEIKPDICFLGVNGIDANEGLTELEMEIVTVKRAMIKASKKVFALAISEKLNSVRKMRVCNLSEIDGLITELNPQNPILAPYQNGKYQII